jgi:mannosylglycoprotein endo-beta-mannosidase
VTVTLSAPQGPVAFFNRLSLVDGSGHERILPVFYSDNYITVLPGETKTVTMDYDAKLYPKKPQLSIYGWNMPEKLVSVE